ncbi:B2 bradykinin receptor [Fundulus heteroclitus]|uniref:B2 bradykinin receptor n=1 Tax=Fundulus heteroclitus TaxID=8078 RepID=UPI00165B3D67|nr:B2 bradykinin receptor [Fundulus heteroclitus]
MAFLPTRLPSNTTYPEPSFCSVENGDMPLNRGEVYILISVLGITFNAFVLIIFCVNKKPYTVPEIYLSNLAAADLVLMSCLPIWAVEIFHGYQWNLGSFLCKLYNQAFDMNYSCSVYFLMMVSIDRYLAVVHPLSCKKIREPLYAKLGCFLVWTLGFLLCIPSFIYHDTMPYYNITVCAVASHNLTTVLTIKLNFFVFTFIVPIFVISFCTVMILKRLRRRLPEGLKVQKTERRATTLVLACLLAFLVCWTPFNLIKIAFFLYDFEHLTGCRILKMMDFYEQIFVYLAYFNSVLNPIIYVIAGKNFRGKIKVLFKLREEEQTS